MPTYAVYLKPRASFKSSIGSDTLFGALCWAMRALNGEDELQEMLNKFKNSINSKAPPPFAISSAFPFIHHDGEKARLYPRPIIPELNSDQIHSLAERLKKQHSYLDLKQRSTSAAAEKAKQIKGAAYVSEELFAQIVQGETEAFHLCQHLVKQGSVDTDIVSWDGALITHGERKKVKAEELDSFAKDGDVQHNEIDRLTQATVEGRLFFTDEKFLDRKRAGLWFILRTEDLNFIKPLLRYLADTGIGGERTAGKGHFHISLDEINPIKLPGVDNPNCFVTLSRYIPAEGECDFDREPLSYRLTTIRPKHEAQFSGPGHRTYKQLMRLFEPGSFFPFLIKKEVYGQIVNAGAISDKGGFDAYHNGLAVPVFAKIGG